MSSTHTKVTPVPTNATSTHEVTPVVEMVTQHLAKGQVPPNELLHTELGHTKEYLDAREAAARRPEEVKVIRDVKDLVDAASETLEEKNRNDLFQNFMQDISSLIQKQKFGGDKTEVREEMRNLLASSRTTVVALFRSSHFRKAIFDFIKLFQESFSRQGKTINLVDVFSLQNIPEEERLKVRAHGRTILKEVSSHPDSNKAMESLLNLWQMLSSEMYSHVDQAKSDPDLERVYAEGKAIVESYTGGRNLDVFILRVRKVIAIIDRDAELKQYLNDWREHIRDALHNKDSIEGEAYEKKGTVLIERGRLFADRYNDNPDFNALFQEAALLGDAVKYDPYLRNLQHKANEVGKNFVYMDEKGNKHVDTDLVALFRAEIIPFLLSRIKEIPVPGFEQGDDPDSDFEYLKVDDLFVSVDDVLPDHIKVHSENHANLSLADLDPSLKGRMHVYIKIDGVRISVRDFYFNFKRKMIKDEGRADLLVTGDGLGLTLRYDMTRADKGSALSNPHVDVFLDKVQIKIREANHKLLLKLGTAIFKEKIRRQIEITIRQKLVEFAGTLAETLNKQVLGKISIGDIKNKVLA